MADLKNTEISDTGFLQIPVGTTAQRPASGTPGMIRYNTDSEETEVFVSGVWSKIGSQSVEASGGNVTTENLDGISYTIHEFSSVGASNFTVANAGSEGTVDVLIVAGGGGGGGDNAGGGGAGGVIFQQVEVAPGDYAITVGDGGTGADVNFRGSNGGNSTAFGLTALGGGGGGGGDGGGTQVGSTDNRPGGDGGSGGGGASEGGDAQGGQGQNGQGCPGGAGNNGAGGGGGGAANSGQDAGSSNQGGNGGDGVYYGNLFGDNFGENGYFAGGGGGASENSQTMDATRGLGGLGGGGFGGDTSRSVTNDGGSFSDSGGENGAPNTGGGGGGHSCSDNCGGAPGGSGGSGIVLIRYPSSPNAVVVDDFEYLANGENVDGINGWQDSSGNVTATSGFSQIYTWSSPGSRFLRWTSVSKGAAVKAFSPAKYKAIQFYAGIDGGPNNSIYITFRGQGQDVLEIRFTDLGPGESGELRVNNTFIGNNTDSTGFGADGATHIFDLQLDYGSNRITGNVQQTQENVTRGIDVPFLNNVSLLNEIYVWTGSSDVGHLDELIMIQ